MTVVVYSFLAFLLSVRAPHRVRVFIVTATALLIDAVARSSLYLGAHWNPGWFAALVPPPRTHRHRYFGVLAPNSPLRSAVTAMAAPA